MLSKALMGYGTVLGSIRSSMSGPKPATMPFVNEYGAADIPMHHFQPSEMIDFYGFERGRTDQMVSSRESYESKCIARRIG